MNDARGQSGVPGPIVVTNAAPDSDELFGKEWLITNRLGAYASGTTAGANTRRYHGLLIAAMTPPVNRVVTLSCLADEFIPEGAADGAPPFDLSTFEFAGAICPDARPSLVEVRSGPAARFVYQCGETTLVKEIVLADSANAVAVRYRLTAGPGGRVRIRPFLALRDHHALRHTDDSRQMTYLHYHDGIRVEDRRDTRAGLHLSVDGRRAGFASQPQWWHKFLYRADVARGQDGSEDLYTPGAFVAEIGAHAPVQLTASVDDPKDVNFDAEVDRKERRIARAVEHLGPDADETTRRLAVAADAFIVQRRRPNAHPATSIIAGYPWFDDWGRDAMIALPGLLLETGRLDEAGDALRLYADSVDDGLVPNFFNAPGEPPSFNTIDASLWFIVAADRYLQAGGAPGVWDNHLAPAVTRILTAYRDGTRFDIRADADGLIAGGDANTQLTWMDAQAPTPTGPSPVTPRHGKCVEINALWHAGLRVAAKRCGGNWGELAENVAAAFAATFWSESTGCLFDCIRGDEADAAIRPNQIIAVSLPDCPLPAEQQRSVVEVVRRELLTPMGLRTLAPGDPAYRGRYGVSWESRDRAYHQGMVWAWLMGPFVEAHLRVNDFSPEGAAEAGEWLAAFDTHLREAGIGTISEIFDGDAPHAPRGCIAQAWSVAEALRAKRLVARAPAR